MNQGKQAHSVLKYRVPHGSQVVNTHNERTQPTANPCWARGVGSGAAAASARPWGADGVPRATIDKQDLGSFNPHRH